MTNYSTRTGALAVRILGFPLLGPSLLHPCDPVPVEKEDGDDGGSLHLGLVW